jgi:hypothetical protein
VAVGRAGFCFDIRFVHCTSCLFDNSSVKLCKHDTPLLFAPSGANHEQGLGQARPNKITSKLARVADVKSRWNTTFSRIENLWPRDGSCLSLFRPKQKYRFQTGSRFPKLGVQVPIEVSPIAGSPLAPNLRSCPCVAAALSGSPAFCAGSWSGIQIQTACAVFKVRV